MGISRRESPRTAISRSVRNRSPRIAITSRKVDLPLALGPTSIWNGRRLWSMYRRLRKWIARIRVIPIEFGDWLVNIVPLYAIAGLPLRLSPRSAAAPNQRKNMNDRSYRRSPFREVTACAQCPLSWITVSVANQCQGLARQEWVCLGDGGNMRFRKVFPDPFPLLVAQAWHERHHMKFC